METPKGITPAMVSVVLSHVGFNHAQAAKGQSFWRRFFGDDPSISLEHIAKRMDVCREIAHALNLANEWQGVEQANSEPLTMNPYAERKDP